MAHKGVDLTGEKARYDWNLLEIEFMKQEQYSAVKPWWENIVKQPYGTHITKRTKGWAKERQARLEQVKDQAQERAVAIASKQISVDMEEALKLEKRLFTMLQLKIKSLGDTPQELEASAKQMGAKEFRELQEILYRFMGKPNLISQNTNMNITTDVHVFLNAMRSAGALQNPFLNPDGTPRLEPENTNIYQQEV